ncbi:hypothetical protein CHELA40_15511 [Chelatococcus asaccharovorans]|nr:hypothetical protein CHELA17_60104 [Chelatococcus asaccharovorans]CAH1682734.1 hypothetical protein CHELA40_15511 [Chelatococcus asaccharovorans]
MVIPGQGAGWPGTMNIVDAAWIGAVFMDPGQRLCRFRDDAGGPVRDYPRRSFRGHAQRGARNP